MGFTCVFFGLVTNVKIISISSRQCTVTSAECLLGTPMLESSLIK